MGDVDRVVRSAGRPAILTRASVGGIRRLEWWRNPESGVPGLYKASTRRVPGAYQARTERVQGSYKARTRLVQGLYKAPRERGGRGKRAVFAGNGLKPRIWVYYTLIQLY